jgi:hypothetical protein
VRHVACADGVTRFDAMARSISAKHRRIFVRGLGVCTDKGLIVIMSVKPSSNGLSA